MYWSDILTLHWWRKLNRHGRFMIQMLAASMFGEYHFSGWDGRIHYAEYTWKGKRYVIPTTPIEPLG